MATTTSAYPFDISVGGLGLTLDPLRTPNGDIEYREVKGQFSPTDNADQPSDRGAIWADWSLGMGLPRIEGNRSGYAFALNAYTRRSGYVMPAGRKHEVNLPVAMLSGKRIVDIKEFGGDLYFLTNGSQILRLVGGDPTNAVTVAETSGITGFAGVSLQPWRGELVASGGTGLEIFKSGAWQQYSAPASQLGVVTWFEPRTNIPNTWLLGVMDSYGFRKTDGDPSVWTSPAVPGNWGNFTSIGDSSFPITSLAISNRVAMFVKTNGVHSVDSMGYSPNLTKYWEDYLDSESGKVTVVLNSKVFSTHAGILDRIDVAAGQVIDESDYVHPGYGVESTGPIYGDVTAACRDRSWLAAGVYNGTNSYLCFGADPQRLRIPISVPFVWHGAEAWWENQFVTKLMITRLSSRPRRWVATYDTTLGRARLWWIGLPRAADLYQAWEQGEDLEFERAWSVTHLPENYGDTSSRKVPRRGDVTSQNLGSDRTLSIYAQLDRQQPVLTDDDGNDQYTLIPPADGVYTITLAGYGTTSSLIGFSEELASSAEEIRDAIAAIHVDLVGQITVTGVAPFIVTVPHGVIPSCSRGSLDWWLQGTASTSTRQTFLPSETATTGFSVVLRLDGYGPVDNPAIATSIKLRSSVLEDQIDTRTYNVRFAKHLDLLNSAPDGRDPESVKSQLEAFMGSGPVEIIEEGDVLSYGKVEPGIRYIKRKKKNGWEHYVTFRVSFLKRPFYWDSGAYFDDLFIWSSP